MQLHATPYGYYDDFGGFYFDSLEDYEAKYQDAHTRTGCEEYEIQFIDGSDPQLALFMAMQVCQASLERYFDLVDDLTEDKLPAFIWLRERGYTDIDEILSKLEDVSLFEGSVKDYAYEFAEDCIFTHDTPDILRTYFDYDAFARDLELGGDVDTLEVGGTKYVMMNANDF